MLRSVFVLVSGVGGGSIFVSSEASGGGGSVFVSAEASGGGLVLVSAEASGGGGSDLVSGISGGGDSVLVWVAGSSCFSKSAIIAFEIERLEKVGEICRSGT